MRPLEVHPQRVCLGRTLRSDQQRTVDCPMTNMQMRVGNAFLLRVPVVGKDLTATGVIEGVVVGSRGHPPRPMRGRADDPVMVIYRKRNLCGAVERNRERTERHSMRAGHRERGIIAPGANRERALGDASNSLLQPVLELTDCGG